jgi:cellobiose phosphorylase
MHLVTKWDLQSQSLFARNCFDPDLCDRIVFISSFPRPISFTGDRTGFIGRNRSLTNPVAIEHEQLAGDVGPGLGACAAVQVAVEIEPNGVAEIVFLIGQATDEEKARTIIDAFSKPADVETAFRETKQWWDSFLDTLQVETPDPATNFLLNRWLLYQTLSCRIWGRSALYQSSGAYGFRDQLQDVMAMAHAAPRIARDHILRTARRQFVEGDVQHWWHADSGVGVRTRISDDFLWLPFVTAHYVRTTGDAGILDEIIPFIEGKVLENNQVESLSIPAISSSEASLLEHCRRAIALSVGTGPHGLPLIGGGDWNDGLNRVGIGGKGESVWLGWFQICVLNNFAELLALRECHDEANTYRVRAGEIARVIEREAWDGEWYRRGYFDDGSPLGSKTCGDAKIDSVAQTWAAISGAADPDRVEKALRAVEERLVREADRLILLLEPPFDTASPDVGYPPGVRENGGQYTHAAVWVAMAFARRGDGDTAVRLLRLLNPIEHSAENEGCERYKIEPYVLAGDISALADNPGRGGWSWYTGAAGWLYRVWVEEVLGFQRRGDKLRINPVIPKDWDQVRLRYNYEKTLYHITIANPDHCSRGVALVEVDGVTVADKIVTLRDDAVPHKVRVVLGTNSSQLDGGKTEAANLHLV